MRVSEMTDEQLVKQVEDDAVAREIFNRLVLSKLRVSDEVQALEHQRDTIQADYEKAMHRISQLDAIERMKVKLEPAKNEWLAGLYSKEGADKWVWTSCTGPTPLIAACRAIVAAKLGDTVEVPEELGDGHAHRTE